MVLSLSYRRPSYVSSPVDSIDASKKRKPINESIDSRSPLVRGIPDALSFDKIINDGTCPPCTLRDFLNYLKYVERSAENLQFFLWFKAYIQRFSALPESEKVLSPEWTAQQAEAEDAAYKATVATTARKTNISPDAALAFDSTIFAIVPTMGAGCSAVNPFNPPSHSPVHGAEDSTSSEYNENVSGNSAAPSRTSIYRKTEAAYGEADVKLQPFTVQPFREEITRIITIYIADDAPRQLNLSGRERAALLNALKVTTHPTVFREVLATVEWSLRCQAHPNFILWSIYNGNPPRITFARGLGVGGIVGGIICGMVLALSSAGKAWRVFSFVGFFIGIATSIAAWKGMCVVLHGMHHRHLRPWELFGDAELYEPMVAAGVVEVKAASEKRLGISSVSLTSSYSNSYEDEPWVAKYEKRTVVRKVFDREVWIKEPALRQIQDTIFLQAIVGGLIIGGAATGIFCAVPTGEYF
ncbi:hypothetical protein P152DRAFT_514115 [Eremomyces bilateralis CBS 781.70]|uniref:RGS domain-containing protein n=1 Tax=Eremomyces bilateralis CBS 781.70 TaxID=1392243 RepID=A0A6G1G381_9PEZI|nr:uncharacterized protein P152DRAFT_514115 [Eremomyces bilateralis CBS 781.70]KAF1812468.1 hypothetical protein P152DRAFT_514115 [Eremomyces bilateralis CBS 781.70]